MTRHVIRVRRLETLERSIDDACVVIDAGRVVELGAARDIQPGRFDEEIDGTLMPALVNHHTHLELSNVPRLAEPESFQDWIVYLGGQIRASDRVEGVREGVAKCLRFGVAEVWDITQNAEKVRPVLRDSPLRSISFGECLGIGERRPRFDSLLERAIDDSHARPGLSLGISPHAPYTVDERGYERVFSIADERRLPVMTHLAENPGEDRFLLDHTGGFGALYAALGIDPGPPPSFAGGPIRWLAGMRRANSPLVLAHVNYADDEEMDLIKQMRATIVWCPRTHAYFGHPPHRWREMVARGIDVRIGTDSCASSPDLNIVDDLRLVHEQSPEVDLRELWRLCANPARIGSHADFIAYDCQSDQPLKEIIESPGMLPESLWIAGERQAPYSGG